MKAILEVEAKQVEELDEDMVDLIREGMDEEDLTLDELLDELVADNRETLEEKFMADENNVELDLSVTGDFREIPEDIV